ncbi:MAG: hypothetical protein QOJ06_521 [Pseudonocardiales bacterium]|jgi:hypothetical protein|nr:hypothetical protein [Actinomycetota bacterium]MDT7594975.1 hypothetical protein [Pseudonocardiales bacterium]
MLSNRCCRGSDLVRAAPLADAGRSLGDCFLRAITAACSALMDSPMDDDPQIASSSTHLYW